jgi:two-component system LytT family response regulator
MAITEIVVAIIDDEPASIKMLKETLETFREPKLNIAFTTTDPIGGIKKVLKEHPDILFLDIEMPGKSGIEVLRELKDSTDFDCHVVFQTGYQQYTIQALREAAFDFIMKPVDRVDVSNMINRFLRLKYKSSFRDKIGRIMVDDNKRVSLPTTVGLQFFHLHDIVACEYIAHEKGIKPYWAVISTDSRRTMLRRNTKGQDLLCLFNSPDFFMINTGVIINLNHLSIVDYKNRTCIMVTPFENPNYVIARGKMAKFKERFDSML